MAVCCDLEVDVNGEETFLINKKIICSYSGRLSELFSKSACSEKNLKVIFNDFPGGPESFELMSRFCYNNGKIDINPSNISLLHSTAKYMQMNNSVSGGRNLLEQTEKSLEGIGYWSWPELLVALNHCQDSNPVANSSGMLEKYLDSLVGRLSLNNEASPCASISSPDGSGFRFSSDTRSTESLKYSVSRANWWFEDLSVLSCASVEMVVKTMISRKYDHGIISRFLFYYQKSKSYSAPPDDKLKILETVINMLYVLDQSSISYKNLFGILRVVLSLNISKSSRKKLESMIGSRLDQATLDNLLVPSPYGTCYLYDVNLVLRLLKAFLGGDCHISPLRMKKVAGLIDLYIAEVAPDSFLKPSKFLALAMALPDSARDSCDELYYATNIYLEGHAGLSEEEKMQICHALNYEKLSSEACIHLSQNAKFPSKSAAQALISQQSKLKSVTKAINNSKPYTDFPHSFIPEFRVKGNKEEAGEQIVLYSSKLDFSNDNETLRAHLQGMQWRVMELEKVCRKMQSQMAKIMKSRVSTYSSPRSLPRLCS